jgi:hypothetical protein
MTMLKFDVGRWACEVTVGRESVAQSLRCPVWTVYWAAVLFVLGGVDLLFGNSWVNIVIYSRFF